MNAIPYATPERAYRPDIDGLRALAILSVVLFHSGVVRLNGGFAGVDIFFVISGYLIGGQIWSEVSAGAFNYQRFYQRRAKRILPAFFAVIVFTLGAGLLLLSPRDLEQLGRSAFAATLSASNILFWGTTNYFSGSSDRNPLLMTWSLGVEEQFYLLVPVLMAMVARWHGRRPLLVIATASLGSLVFAFIISSHHPMAAFYLLPARAWELGTGVALAVCETSRLQKTASRLWTEIAGVAALGLMIAAVVGYSAELTAPTWTIVPAVTGATLAIAVPGSWVNRRLLAAFPLRFIGKISYSWYLWHWPLLSLMHVLYGGAIPPTRAAETVALSFVFAVASYFVVEQPFRHSTRPAIRMISRYAVASAILLVMCSAIWYNHGVPQRFPGLAEMEEQGETLRSDPCLAGLNHDTPNLSPPCYNTSTGQLLVALWGDSHSAAIAPGLRKLVQEQGYGFVQLGKASCPPLIGATHFIPRIPTLAEGCQRFNNAVFFRLLADSRIRVVVLSAAWAGPFYRDWENGWLTTDLTNGYQTPTLQATGALFVSAIRETVQSLRSSGKQVVVLEDVPQFTMDPLWRVESERIPARQKLGQWLTSPEAHDSGKALIDTNSNIALSRLLLEQTLAQSAGVQLIDPKAALCEDATQCAYREADILLYIDSNHLSAEGARRVLAHYRISVAGTMQNASTNAIGQLSNSLVVPRTALDSQVLLAHRHN